MASHDKNPHRSEAHQSGHAAPTAHDSHSRAPGDLVDTPPAGSADSHHHHGHYIQPPSNLIAVFVALLFFTFVTVALARGEQSIAHHFDIVIPQMVNVMVALSIASIKTFLVVTFFMQLRYDNPVNTLVFLTTLVIVALFLGFTMIDLGTRESIERYEGQYQIAGGTGGIMSVGAGVPITQHARQVASIPGSTYHKYYREDLHHHEGAAGAGHHGGHGEAPAPIISTANRSRPVHGVTLGQVATHPHDAHRGDRMIGEQPAGPTAPRDVERAAPGAGGGH